ncbi:putative E3 ubiquitin-protein ligase UBR7 isoform X1 [Xyrauchen texanus]|uniref:putative E3 ubiquitin-protein ligase UBR7 isoform X1 n=1 Tax=Xyrauchen texanus TaxID=154827 RepID=UPI002241BFBF|nr:putative E3 ubiquitin-protein ligase UBR7 isoform X1 [Xyrauchen texanus]
MDGGVVSKQAANDGGEEEATVSLVDVLEEDEELENEASAVLGRSDSEKCSYPEGYVKRQALYACNTCTPMGGEPAGVCLACSYKCHEGHDLFELYTKSATNNKSKSMQRRKVENDEKVKNENPKSPFDEKVQVNRTSACKRKHQDETEGFTEEGSCSGCRLREMKASVRSRTLQGAVFWPSAWRTKLCTCTDCKILYADAGVSFLMDEIDTVLAYEIKGKSTEQVEQAGGGDGHDPLISALNTLNRVQHLEIIHKYK